MAQNPINIPTIRKLLANGYWFDMKKKYRYATKSYATSEWQNKEKNRQKNWIFI